MSENHGDISNPFSGVLYFGNDLNDLEVMAKVGIALAPSDAHPGIKDIATHVLKSKGGKGFVREGIELLLGLPNMNQEKLSEFISNS